jgi:hypothetical protein
VGPDRVGAGSVIGSVSASDRPPVVIVASGPFPPLDRCRSLVVSAVLIEPSALATRVGFRLVQEPPVRLRTGDAATVRVSEPSGLAVMESVDVVAPSTATA